MELRPLLGSGHNDRRYAAFRRPTPCSPAKAPPYSWRCRIVACDSSARFSPRMWSFPLPRPEHVEVDIPFADSRIRKGQSGIWGGTFQRRSASFRSSRAASRALKYVLHRPTCAFFSPCPYSSRRFQYAFRWTDRAEAICASAPIPFSIIAPPHPRGVHKRHAIC